MSKGEQGWIQLITGPDGERSLQSSVVNITLQPRSEVKKFFSSSTQLIFQMLVSIKISRNSAFFSGSDKPRMLFFLLINVKCQQLLEF